MGAHGAGGDGDARAGFQVEGPAVERTGDLARIGVHPSGAERAAAMRALVVQRVELAAHVEDGDAPAGQLDGLALAGRQSGGVEGGEEVRHGRSLDNRRRKAIRRPPKEREASGKIRTRTSNRRPSSDLEASRAMKTQPFSELEASRRPKTQGIGDLEASRQVTWHGFHNLEASGRVKTRRFGGLEATRTLKQRGFDPVNRT